MGADFVWVRLPLEVTPEEALVNLVAIPEDDLLNDLVHECGQAFDTVEEAYAYVTSLLDIVYDPDFQYRRDVGFDVSKEGHVALVTGGMSWGDPPTDAYEYMVPLSFLGITMKPLPQRDFAD